MVAIDARAEARTAHDHATAEVMDLIQDVIGKLAEVTSALDDRAVLDGVTISGTTYKNDERTPRPRATARMHIKGEYPHENFGTRFTLTVEN